MALGLAHFGFMIAKKKVKKENMNGTGLF